MLKLKSAAFAALALLCVAACTRETPTPPAPEPRAEVRDVILVTIDTWRADAAGFAGNARVKTPFIDSLAQRGIVFNNAHAHNVVTLPSHTNILTGLYPYQHGVRDNAGFVLDSTHATVAEMMRSAGFATAAFVAAFPLDARFGLNRGFDLYDDNYGKGVTTLDFIVQERPAASVLESARSWWASEEGRKRFVWIHLYDPHAPYVAPGSAAEVGGATLDGAAPVGGLTPVGGDLMQAYLDEVTGVDIALAQSLEPMIEDDTLLIVTSDHGEALGDHGEQTHGLFAYEATLQVPLIVVAPGAKSRRENGFVRHIDIVPTILEATGQPERKELPGRSLLQPVVEAPTYFESLSTSLNRGWAPLTGVIVKGDKFIDLPIAELYDLGKDPAEKVNLRSERRRDAQNARKLLTDMLRGGGRTPRRNISAEEAARLRSLGYIAGSNAAPARVTPADDPKRLIALDTKMHQTVDSYGRRDLPRALRLAREIVAERPQMAAGRELLAFMLQQNERLPDAIAALRGLVRDGKATNQTRVQLGLLLTETGNPAEAVKVLAPLAERGDPDLLNAYGIALADEGKLDEAVREFQRVLAADSNNAPALQNLGIVALRKGDGEAAQGYLSRAVALNPRLPLALNTLGVVYAQQNDVARAIEMWNRAVNIDPRQYDALYNIGIVAARAGDKEEARRALTRFVETAPARYAKDVKAARAALATME